MIWNILGPFSSTGCPDKINILKLEQLNHQVTTCIYKGDLTGYETRSWTLWVVFCFSGTWVSGHEFRIPELFNCFKYWKTDNFTLRWLLDLGNTSLEQNLRLKTWSYLLFIPAIFLICCLAVPWPTFDYYRANILTHPMLITAFGPSVFSPKLDWKGWVSTPKWVPSELWLQCHNTPNYRKYSVQT